MRKSNELHEQLNDSFEEIVRLITDLISLSQTNMTSLLEVNEFLEKDAEQFKSDTNEVVESISAMLDNRMRSLNLEGVETDISEASRTFLAIAEELEILSYNTICKTLSLGDAGAAIAYISKEIKKHSTQAKSLLVQLDDVFNSMFSIFHRMSQSIVLQGDKMRSVSGVERSVLGHDFTLKSDISVLIEYSQFHDIIVQELNLVLVSLDSVTEKDPYSQGRKVRLYELAQEKLQSTGEMTESILNSIRSSMSEFVYNLNTDLQSVISRAELVSHEYTKSQEYNSSIEKVLAGMKAQVDESGNSIAIAHQSIDEMQRFSKSFRNLVVITSIEVSRLAREDMTSLISSMVKTYEVLNSFIGKMEGFIDTWKGVRDNLDTLLKGAFGKIDDLRKLHSSSKMEQLSSQCCLLDQEMNAFRQVMDKGGIIERLDEKIRMCKVMFADLNRDLVEEGKKYSASVPSSVKASAEYRSGYAEAEMNDILAHEDSQSTIEFF